MNTLKIAAAAALLTMASAGAAFAQSDTGAGSITILRPLTVTNTQGLNFGKVIRPASGSGDVAIDATGVRTVDVGIGEGGAAITVTVDPNFVLSIGGSTDLTVTLASAQSGAQTLSGATNTDGDLLVVVTGEVTIANTTETGAYTGSFTVSAVYN
jgi:hypothetical protein